MKKLKILLSVVAIGLIAALHRPAQLITYAALSEPSGYEYKYKAELQGDGKYHWLMQKVGGASAEYEYQRTADGGYYNYTTTMTNTAIVPFPITITFNRSNTPWASGFDGYLPSNTAYIGSNSSTGEHTKYYFVFNNNTPHDYVFIYDFSSSPSQFAIEQTENSQAHMNWVTNSLTYNRIILKAHTTYTFHTWSNLAIYLDAFYLDDLGVSTAYNVGYGEGYDDGEYEGFNSGYGVGYDEGSTEGYSEGQSDFFYGLYGVWDGLIQDSVPFTTGYQSGYNMSNPTDLIGSLVTEIFTGMAPIFAISIVGGITLGSFIIIPLSQTVLSWFFRTFGGGK